MDLIYTLYEPSLHLDAVVHLEKYLWEGFSEEKLKEVFAWKYPIGGLRNAFVALDGDRVVAFRGFFINTYQYEGKTFPVAVLGDAVTDPEYQRRGIFSKLTEYALNYFQRQGLFSILALSSNEKSSGGYVKLGWKPFSRKRINIRVVWRNILPKFCRYKRRWECRLHKRGVVMEDFDGISESLAQELAEYCALQNSSKCICLLKDKQYWLYRYRAPQWAYRFVVLRRENAIKGYACYLETEGHANGIKHTKILDIAASDDRTFAYLIRAVENRTSGYLMLIYTASLPEEDFRRIKKEFPIMKYERHHNASDEILVKPVCATEEMAVSKLWSLSYIDIDSM